MRLDRLLRLGVLASALLALPHMSLAIDHTDDGDDGTGPGNGSGGGPNPPADGNLGGSAVIGSGFGSAAAAVDFPIEVPSGPRGLAPELSIAYSPGSNGWFGHGFDLSGLGMIRSEGKTPGSVPTADAAVNNYVVSCAIASGRLVTLSEEDGTFETEIASHVEIEQLDEDTWTARTKTNTVFTFGGSDGGSRVGGVWRLSKIEDASGNTIDIDYHEGTGAPNTIDYANRKVVFNYSSDTRPDLVPFSNYGRSFTYGYVVESIDVFINDTLLRGYDIAYEQRGPAQKSFLNAYSGRR